MFHYHYKNDPIIIFVKNSSQNGNIIFNFMNNVQILMLLLLFFTAVIVKFHIDDWT